MQKINTHDGEISYKVTAKYRLFLILTSFSTFSLANGTCDMKVTKELEYCVKNHFSVSESQLTSKFLEIGKLLHGKDKSQLLNAQKFWLKYRHSFCQKAFDEINPGAEAGIEKWSCIDNVTAIRIAELRYISGEVDMDEFFRSLEFISRQYEGGDMSAVIRKMGTLSAYAGDKDWSDYVNENCKVTHSKVLEERDVCIARQNFYKTW
jgi:uncharacterized protein YecT (DUF1311 family)